MSDNSVGSGPPGRGGTEHLDTSNVLRIGDFIHLQLLKDLKLEGFLSAEYAFGDNCSLCTDTDNNFGNCLWEVCVQNQYSALCEYKALLASTALTAAVSNISSNNATSKAADSVSRREAEVGAESVGTLSVESAKKAAKQERRMNEKLMISKHGKVICYGDPIQLRHVKSGKYLTVSSSMLAADERENMRVSVDIDGNNLSCFEFMPRHRFVHEGDSITSHSETVLRLHERTSEFIHGSLFEGASGVKEVNCSLDSSVWVAVVYQSCSDLRSDSLLAGQLVALQDPDNQCSLTVRPVDSSCKVSVSGVSPISSAVHVNAGYTAPSGGGRSNTSALLSPTSFPAMEAVMAPQYQLEDGSNYNINIGTDILWLIEKENVATGGVIYTKVDEFILKNLNTGLFLKLEPTTLTLNACSNRSEASLFRFLPTQLAPGKQSSIVRPVEPQTGLHLIVRATGSAASDCDVNIDATSELWISPISEEKRTRKDKSVLCVAQREKSQAISIQVSPALQKKFGDALHVGIQAAQQLRKFFHTAKSFQSKPSDRALVNAFGNQMKFIVSALKEFPMFLTGSDNYSFPIQTIKDRKAMLREQGFIDALMDTLELLSADAFTSRVVAAHFTPAISSSVRQLSTSSALDRKLVHQAPLTNSNSSINSSSGGIRGRRKAGALAMLRLAASSSATTSSASLSSFLPPEPAAAAAAAAAASPPTSVRGKVIYTSGATRPAGGLSARKTKDPSQQSLQEDRSELVDLCLSVLQLILKNDHASQDYITNRFPVLLHLIGNNSLAVKCVEEMLKDNLSIVQTKVREREINLIVKLLSDTDMGVTYLKLLRLACSSPMGVDSTQRMIVQALFANSPSNRSDKNSDDDDDDNNDDSQGSNNSHCLGGRVLSVKYTSSEQQTLSSGVAPDEETLLYTDRALIFQLFTETERVGAVDSRGSWTGTRASIYGAPSEGDLVPPGENSSSKGGAKRSGRFATEGSGRSIRDFGTGLDADPSSGSKTDTVLGVEVLSGGLPPLFISWDKDIYAEYGMGTLYNCTYKVPFDKVCGTYTAKDLRELEEMKRKRPRESTRSPQAGAAAGTEKKKSPSINRSVIKKRSGKMMDTSSLCRIEVGEFFKAQLYLVADLCLDRNYVSIGILEQMYDYTALIVILKTENISNAFKAPACRIIRCLYVDRDPQVAAKFPNYIRISPNLIEKDPTIRARQTENPSKFALVQCIISDYVKGSLDTTECDELSVEMTNLLEALIDFGFYNTIEQFEDIRKPLFHILDTHVKLTTSSGTPKDEPGDGPEELASEADREEVNAAHRTSVLRWSPDQVLLSSSGDQSQAMRESALPETYSSGILPRMFRRLSIDLPLAFNSLLTTESSFSQWCKRMLSFLNSISGLSLSLLVVLVSVVFSIISVSDRHYLKAHDTINLVTTVYFALELLLRSVCHVKVYQEVKTFAKDPMNILDFVLVGFDVSLLVLRMQSQYANLSEVERIVRIIRFARLVRFLKIGKLLKRIKEKSNQNIKWHLLERYNADNAVETQTLVNMIRILSKINRWMEDARVQETVSIFFSWMETHKSSFINSASPIEPELLRQVYLFRPTSTADASAMLKYENILLDLMMYADKSLVQESLSLLMSLKSGSDVFFKTAYKTQIICSPKLASTWKQLAGVIKELRKMGEQFEMWSDLETDSQKAQAAEMMRLLTELRESIQRKNTDKSFGIKNSFLIDEEVQTMLSNLDLFPCIMMVLVSLYDGGREELKPEVVQIMRSCHILLESYVKDCPQNQAEAFTQIEWFMDLIDEDVNSSIVLRALVDGNKELIKAARPHISTFIHKIVAKGQRPEYLDLFTGMTENSELLDCRVRTIETDISNYLTSRQWQGDVLLWCCDPDDKAYADRIKAMAPYLENDALVEEHELREDLRYHIRLLNVLAGCHLGPKLQAIYYFQDIAAAMVDENTITLVRIALGKLFVSSMKNLGDRLGQSVSFWLLLEYIVNSLSAFASDIASKPRSEWSVPERIHRGEWIEVAVVIIGEFYEQCDDQTFHSFKSHNTSLIPQTLTHQLIAALNSLQQEHEVSLGPYLTALITETTKLVELWSENNGKDVLDNDDLDDEIHALASNKLLMASHKRSSVIFADLTQQRIRRQFFSFISGVQNKLEDALDNSSEAVRMFERIPLVNDQVTSSVRFEPLLGKLVDFYKGSIRTSKINRFVDEEVYPTLLWFLKTLRLLFEKNLKQKKDDRAKKVELLRTIYSEAGLVVLCLDLLAIGVKKDLYTEAMRLLIVLLSEPGGCKPVQTVIYNYLSITDSSPTFEWMKDVIEHLKGVSEKGFLVDSAVVDKSEIEESVLPAEFNLFRLLQLICEGATSPLKNQIREQSSNNSITINILDSIAMYITTLSTQSDVVSLYTLNDLLYTVVKLVRGPCEENQEHFVLHSDLLISVNRIIRMTRPEEAKYSVAWRECLDRLKVILMDVVAGLLENRHQSSLVFERVTTTVDMNRLELLIFEDIEERLFFQKDLHSAQSKFLVVRTIIEAANSSQHDLTFSMEDFKSKIVPIEIVRNGQIHVKNFYVPEFVTDLSNESKLRAIDAVPFDHSQELKLQEFVTQCLALYRESVHQQFLKKYNLEFIWSLKFYVVSIMFLNAIVLNTWLVIYYGTVEDGHKYNAASPHRRRLAREVGGEQPTSTEARLHLPERATIIADGLIIVQMILSVATIIIYAIGQVPVTFKAQYEHTKSFAKGVLASVTDPLPLWYVVYFTFVVFGLFGNRLILSVLLLDIFTLSDVASDLLKAMLFRTKQLGATLIMLLIAVYIFMCLVFRLYRYQVKDNWGDRDGEPLYDMWETFKFGVSYGIRGGFGVDNEMILSIRNRFLLDAVITIVIQMVLREIFLAIIIDTFDTFRDVKYQKNLFEKNTCFICGQKRSGFDQANAVMQADGKYQTFEYHRQVVHKSLHYLYFILVIAQQNPVDDDGMEAYVRRCLINNDVSWFPIGANVNCDNDDMSLLSRFDVDDESDSVDEDGSRKHNRRRHQDGENDLDTDCESEDEVTWEECSPSIQEAIRNLQVHLNKLTAAAAAVIPHQELGSISTAIADHGQAQLTPASLHELMSSLQLAEQVIQIAEARIAVWEDESGLRACYKN